MQAFKRRGTGVTDVTKIWWKRIDYKENSEMDVCRFCGAVVSEPSFKSH